MNLKTALGKIEELESRIRKLEKTAGNVLYSEPNQFTKRMDELQEPYRIEVAKKAKSIVQETFGMISKKKGTDWLKQIKAWRDESRV